MAIYQRTLLKIPEDCQKILRLTAQDITYKEIARQLGFRSESYVRKRRHFCKEFLINKIKEDPDYQAILQAIRAAKVRQQEYGRPDIPGFRPGDYYVRWMKRFGILPESFDPEKDPLDCFQADEAYYRSLWHRADPARSKH